MPSFYEFFAGGGMARAGFGASWKCLLANDIDTKKAAAYKNNWGDSHFIKEDVAKLSTQQLPGHADMAWASFPCQDLSLAGSGNGLNGKRSGTFWPFWKLMSSLADEGRAPKIIVLENVCGALTSHGGKDFSSIVTALTTLGYDYGALIMDAAHFVPQSRPRLFIIAIRKDVSIPQAFISSMPSEIWSNKSLQQAYNQLPRQEKNNWVWWHIPAPKRPSVTLHDIFEETPTDISWHAPTETERLINMMSPVNKEKLNQAINSGTKTIGTIYKRTRFNETGERVQRAEVRFDGIAGCLRTPAGGSSRQTVIVVEGKKVRTRLLSSREAARLMGLPDSYRLPERYNEAYHLLGDGLVVPVVQHLALYLLEPLAFPKMVKKAA